MAIAIFLSIMLSLVVTTFAQQEDLNGSACATIDHLFSVCESLTPGFTAYTNFNVQAPCLCYASSYWLPNGYDGWFQSCDAGWKTGNPSAYSTITARLGGPPNLTPCQMAGNVLSSPTFTGPVTALVAPITRPPITNSEEAACAALNGALADCNRATPGFQTLTNFRDQASCYCYSIRVFNPSSFDSVWPSCMRFLSTASPSVYSRVSADGGPVHTTAPCAAVGDVRDVRGGTPSPTGSSTSSLSTPVTSSSEFVFNPTPTSGSAGRNEMRTSHFIVAFWFLRLFLIALER